MIALEELILRVKRAESPGYARLKRLARRALVANPQFPGFLNPLFRLLYHFHFFVLQACQRLVVMLYRYPLFRSRCASVGRNLYLEQLPNIGGHTRIVIGNDVYISGDLSIGSSRVLDEPQLIIGDRVFIGHKVTFDVDRMIVIEEGAGIAQGCYIADNDGHPRSREARVQGLPTPAEEIRPVRICRDAWVGRGSYILKNVTIGEGAIVAAGSVVLTDIPAFSIAVGNPARVVQRQAGRE